MAVDALIDSLPLPDLERCQRLNKTAKKLAYWQRRNAQACRSHTKTKLAKLEQLDIPLSELPHCRPG